VLRGAGHKILANADAAVLLEARRSSSPVPPNDALRLQTEEAALKVEQIAAPFATNPLAFPELMREWAIAWRSVAYARSETSALRLHTEEAALKVEQIAAPFATNPLAYPELMRQRATAWRCVAHAHEQSGGHAGHVERAVLEEKRILALIGEHRSQ
jgi:hypothetical protein